MTLVTTLVIHPALVEAGLETWVIVLIEALIGATVMIVLIFVVSPWLNEVFAEDSSVKEVDPNSTPSGNSNTSKIAIFSAIAGTVYMARRKPAKAVTAKKAVAVEPTHEDLLSKINNLVTA